ncbi:MAG TPA: SMP-30/gluconolactonase/LRE family protein [Gaiellales bacterium]
MQAEQITEAIATHGEGPCWLARSGELGWVDMLAGRVLATSLATSTTQVIEIPGPIAAIIRPRAAGGLVVATETGVVLLDEYESPTPLCEIIAEPGIRMNDGACDPQGRFWCGSMAYDHDAQPEAGSLWRVGADGAVATALTGIGISNGLDWSDDGTTAFYVDTPTGRIDTFAFDGATGELSERRPFAEIERAAGMPDGLTIDAEGGVWVALWEGGAVRRYAPDGTLDAVVSLPCGLVTACTFGGPDLDELFITTSRLGLPPGADPAGGSLFRCRPGVRGRAVREFAG